MIDLHVHTALCGHAEGSPLEYVRAAADRGVNVLGISDHLPVPPELLPRIPGAEDYAMAASEVDGYVAGVLAVVAEGRALGVEVLLGIEADLVPEGIAPARAIAAAHPFDFVLGSIHFIDDWAFDDPARMDRYAEWDTRALWERYFDLLVSAASSGVADVIAHADLVKKFCRRPERPVDDLYHEAAEVFSEAGVAVEVNTAGLRKPCREIYPAQAFLRILRAAGVPATLGSDAHTPDDVGRDLDVARAALREAGYRSVLIFRNRIPEEVALDGA